MASSLFTGNSLRRKPQRIEQEHCRALIAWASIASATKPELKLLFHIGNGGYRARTEAKILNGMGIKPGVPDYMLPIARGGFHGLFLEMKAPDGRLSPAQQYWIQELSGQFYKTVVCFSWEAAKDELVYYLKSDRMSVG